MIVLDPKITDLIDVLTEDQQAKIARILTLASKLEAEITIHKRLDISTFVTVTNGTFRNRVTLEIKQVGTGPQGQKLSSSVKQEVTF